MDRPAIGRRVLAAACIILGAIPVGVSTGLIPAQPDSVRAPRYIVALAGLLFWLAAVSLLAGASRPRLNNLIGGSILAAFAILGGWVSVFGAEGVFRGGIPFVSSASNEWIARVMLGAGSAFCAALSVHAFGKAARGAA